MVFLKYLKGNESDFEIHKWLGFTVLVVLEVSGKYGIQWYLLIMYKSISQFIVMICDVPPICICSLEHCNFFKPCSSLLILEICTANLVFLFTQNAKTICVILCKNDI